LVIKGKVVDLEGRPIGGAKVSEGTDILWQKAVKTGPTGDFTYTLQEHDPYFWIMIEASGFATQAEGAHSCPICEIESNTVDHNGCKRCYGDIVAGHLQWEIVAVSSAQTNAAVSLNRRTDELVRGEHPPRKSLESTGTLQEIDF